MVREYERVTCPLCHREISAYVPFLGDGSDVRIIRHNLVKSGRTQPVKCPASGCMKGELEAAKR